MLFRSLVVGGAMALMSASTLAQDEPADFQSAFRALLPSLMTSDWETALPLAEAALPLAQSPAENYRIRHMLTDINGRLHNWDAAGRYASEAAAVIHGDEGLSANMMVMASHMAAEEGRAAIMLGDEARAAEANARMISDHPDAAPRWSVAGEIGATHTSGLSCELMRSDFLRFDVYGGAEGDPSCQYWSHEDIGVRITQGRAADADLARNAERFPNFQAVELVWDTDLPFTEVDVFRLSGAPGRPDQRLIILESVREPWTVSVIAPEASMEQAMSTARAFYLAGPDGTR